MTDKESCLPANTPAIGSGAYKAEDKNDICGMIGRNCPHLRSVQQNGCIVTFSDTNGCIHTIDLSLCVMTQDPFPEICAYIDANCPKVESVTGDCVDNTDPLNPKINLPKILGDIVTYDPVGKCYSINETCTNFDFNPVTCELVYTNEKNQVESFVIPTANYAWDGCTLTIVPAKGQAPLSIAIKNSTLTPDYASGIITHVSGDGTVQNVDICRMVCENCKPAMTCEFDQDGNRTVAFQDGCGGQKLFDIPAVHAHVGNYTINGSTITLVGENGNQITFDVCDIVVANCCAKLVVNTDGSFVFTGNDGNDVVYTPECHCDSNVTVNGDYFDFTMVDGTTAQVCRFPVKEICFTNNVDVTYEPNAAGKLVLPAYPQVPYQQILCENEDGTTSPVLPNAQGVAVIPFKSDTENPLGLQGIRCQTATGEFITVPIAEGAIAEIPYKPECIKCVTPDGDFLDVPLNTATGCYEIPSKFTDPVIRGEGDITVNYIDGEWVISYNEPAFCCENPDGTLTDLVKTVDGKFQIPFKDIPVVSGQNTTVTFINGEYVVDVSDHLNLKDKDGNDLPSGATVLQPNSFAASNLPAPTGVQLLAFNSVGDCVTYTMPALPVIPDDVDNITTFAQSSVIIDLENPPAVPDGAPANKLDGDTHLVCYGNALCAYTCVGGTWVNNFCKPFLEPPVLARAAFDCDFNAVDDGVDGLVTNLQVDAWLDQNLEFSADPLLGITNPCCNTVRGSTNSSADQCSSVEQAVNSEALGLRTVVEAATGVSIDAASRYTVASGFGNDIDDARQSHISGTNNEVGLNGNRSVNDLVAGQFNNVAITGNTTGNLVVGSSNDVGAINATQATYNIVGGLDNDLDQASANNVTGNANVLVNDVRYNQVTGTTNLLDGTQGPVINNTVSGFNNQLLGAGNNQVTGAGNILSATDTGVNYNQVAGQGNQVLGDATGLGAADNNNAGSNTISGLDNIMYGTRNLMVGWVNCSHERDGMVSGVNNDVRNGAMGVVTGWYNVVDIAGLDGGYLSGRGTRKVNPWTDVSGFSGAALAKGGALSSSRTYEKSHQSGNVQIAGAFTAGFAFPDFGEYAVVDKEIDQGLFLVYEGTYKARVAKEGEDFDGISRDEIPVAAGGGIDPDNNPWLVDEFGNRQRGEIKYAVVDVIVDEEATKKATETAVKDAQKKADAEYETALKLFESDEENLDKPEKVTITENDVSVIPVMKEVESEETIENGYLKNPDFDPELHASIKTVGVSMMGRVWMQVDGEVKVGDYLQAGKEGKGVVSKDKTRAKVLEVKDSLAFVSIK